MNFLETLAIASRGLRSNKLRTALTVLGISIGVGAVILLVAVGNGSSKAVQDRINRLGTNTLTVFSQNGLRARGGQSSNGTQTRSTQLSQKDFAALQDKSANPDIAAVAPVVNAQSVTGSYNGATYSPGQFVGTNPSYSTIRDYPVVEGSFFTNDDVTSRARVAVIGQTVATNLFGTADPINKQVLFGSQKFTIVGLLKAKGSNGAQDQDDIVIAPYTVVQESLTGTNNGFNQLIVQAVSSKQMNNALNEVTNTLRTSHKLSANANNDFQVLNQATLIETSSSTNEVFTVLLGAVAAISLLVGGIGVMNVMLVSVTERTREIGIRKAIGASKSAILGQFISEAIFVSLFGGLAGIVIGFIGARFKIIGIVPVVATYSVFLAFGVAVAVGLFFGLYPANRAANLRPIDALRHE